MSDCQKGLIPTIQELLRNAEHKRCARHIWSNWSINLKEEERRKQFWRCTKASYEVKLKDDLAKLAKPNEVDCVLIYWPKTASAQSSQPTQPMAPSLDRFSQNINPPSMCIDTSAVTKKSSKLIYGKRQGKR